LTPGRQSGHLNTVTRRRPGRRAGITAALTMGPIAAWRFAQAYRARAAYPHRHPPDGDPGDLGLPFEDVEVESGPLRLPGWWIPSRDGAAGPAVLLVHGWESTRDRTLPNAAVMHASGLHVLTIDVRGHGANPAEELPVTTGEFGADALAGLQWLLARPEVTRAGVLGHSMGGVGALLAAAAEPRTAAVVAVSTPADPYRLTRQTFRLARLPLPGPFAYPLAWLTTHVVLEPRGHTVRSVSASRAAARYRGPLLLVHGTADRVVPIAHLRRLARSARRGRAHQVAAAPVDVLELSGADHSWLYEIPAYRASVARFLARWLAGPISPDAAATAALAIDLERPPERRHGFSAMDDEPGGLRTLLRAVRTGRTAARRST
jgi:uncharacterized protein